MKIWLILLLLPLCHGLDLIWNCPIDTETMAIKNWDDPHYWQPTKVPSRGDTVTLTNIWCWPMIVSNVEVETINNQGGLFLYGKTLHVDHFVNDGRLAIILGRLYTDRFEMRSGELTVISSSIETPFLNLNQAQTQLILKDEVHLKTNLFNVEATIKIISNSTAKIESYSQDINGNLEFMAPNAVLLVSNLELAGTITINVDSRRNMTLIRCVDCREFKVSSLNLKVKPDQMGGTLQIDNERREIRLQFN